MLFQPHFAEEFSAFKDMLPHKMILTRQSVNELLQSADPKLTDEDIDRAVGLLWVNAFACSNGGGQVVKAVNQSSHVIIIFSGLLKN